ncbi:solute carrier family 2, facilitated glucose transporter member 11-like [Syngnathus typhle]
MPAGTAEQDNSKASSSKTLALTVCSAAIGGTFQYGYNLSIINSPTSYIQMFINNTYAERWGSGLESTHVTLVWTLIVSAFSLGGLLGALLAGPMAVRLGRVYSYASYIFLQANIPADKIHYATIGTGASELTASILSNLLIERVGRKCLLVGGYALMSCWSIVFTVALTLQKQGFIGMPYLSMACVFAYILSFGLGPAGVTGVLPAEIFDQSARPAAYMVAGSLMWLSLLLVGMIFPFMVKGLGNFCLLPFFAVCLLSAVFLGITFPETKGKSLAEITAKFDQKNGRIREPGEERGGGG